jgi:hypothetical protein
MNYYILFGILLLVLFLIIYILRKKNIEYFDLETIDQPMPFNCGMQRHIDLSKNTPIAPI